MKEIQSFKTHLERLGYSKSSVYMLPGCVKDFLTFIGKSIPTIQTEVLPVSMNICRKDQEKEAQED